MATTSLYDLAILDRADEYTGLIEDVTTLAPEFEVFSAMKRPGTWYKTVKRTTLPTVQFRNANAGTTASKSGYKSEIKEMFFLDARLNMDEAVWEADSAHLGSLWQLEAAGAVRAASILIGQQTWYGTSADSSGFTGIRSQLADSVAAGGTTNSTSAYLVWMDEKEGVRYDVGMDGQFAISAPFRQQIVDPNDSTKAYFAYVGNLKSWIGLNVLSNLSAWAVTGVTSTSTQWLTDDRASQLLAKIPVARRNNLRWFINRTTQSVLNRSRTTINPGITTYSAAYSMQPADAGGRPAFAPLPETCLGYPITLTDSILNTETNS
jgi:hypothetical protein